MPAYLTHRAAGEMVLNRLKDGEIQDDKAFYLGCQGPDILFFNSSLRAARKSLLLALRMHRENVREMWATALDYAKHYNDQDRDELIAYISGFITHYAIDKNAHPFVYGKAGKNTSQHNRIEFMWDSYVAKEQWGIEPQQFDIYSEVMYDKVGEGICEWYKVAAWELYGKKIRERLVRQAQRHFAEAKSLLANINFLGKVLIKIIKFITGFDIGVLRYPEQRSDEWFSDEEYEDMQAMLQKGVSEACEMIGFALDYIAGDGADQLPAWFGDTDFSGAKV